MKLIPLTRGKFAMVDDEDYDELMKHKWYAIYKRNTWYAERSVWHMCNIKMHQEIMGNNPLKLKVDHKDGDGLNNQRLNLRHCTTAENCMNIPSHKDSFSVYKGIYHRKERDKWVAEITKNGVRIYRKEFATEIEAARQYDVWSLELHGEFAKLNFPV